MKQERVVITGMGAVSPLGLSARASFDALVAGRSGIVALPDIPPGMEVRVGGAVRGFERPATELRAAQPIGRFAQFSLAAAREAIEDAELAAASYEPERVGVVLGVGMGAVELVQSFSLQLAAEGPDALSPCALDATVPTLATELVAHQLDARGPSYCTVSACASSAHAIGESLELLRAGAVDCMVTGGAEAGLVPLGIAMFERMGALSKRCDPPASASRPFDAERDGFVMGEGGAVLVLETLRAARRRGAHVYAELAGYGASADAFHVTRPPDGGDGMALAMSLALADAELNADEVDYVNAHGTGTPYNDVAETLAIKRVFGAHAARLWISSNKSMTGHLLGGAAALEAIATAYTIERGQVPPTVNLDRPDPRCDLDYVPWTARERRTRVAISNSFGFGGQNASLVLRAI